MSLSVLSEHEYRRKPPGCQGKMSGGFPEKSERLDLKIGSGQSDGVSILIQPLNDYQSRPEYLSGELLVVGIGRGVTF